MHVVTLSFDDGFERSSLLTAEIFERHRLAAELHVLAAGHLGEPADPWHGAWPKGDFALWNELKARGHHVMPHGYRHADKAQLPLAEAQRLIERCLDVFGAELGGFEPAEASFAFPYNRSTPALEAWLGARVRAYRTRGDPVMPLPRPGQQRVTCAGFGPGRCDDHLLGTIDSFLAGPPGWLCYNLHGLDDEGWGPGATCSTACSSAWSHAASACSRSRPHSTPACDRRASGDSLRVRSRPDDQLDRRRDLAEARVRGPAPENVSQVRLEFAEAGAKQMRRG